MKRASVMRLLLVLIGAGLAGHGDALAEDPAGSQPIRLLSQFALTPDGEGLVFAWRGELWRAASAGGAATRLTFHPAADAQPRVSPDGEKVAFVSNRTGSSQVHVMPLSGGAPRAVTLFTEGYRLLDWSPSGDAVLVRTRLDHHYRLADRFFLKPLDPKRGLELLFDAHGGSAKISPDGRKVAFTREGTAWWRKGYRGSQAGQIWLYDREEETYRKLSEGDHEERWPLWAPDGEHLYVTSQESGTFNLYQLNLESGARRQLTHYEDDGVLFPEISADGSTIVYRRLFDLWRLRPATGDAPQLVEIHDRGDPTVDPVLRRTLTKATAVGFTDDAREIAFVAGGDLWVMDTELKEPKQVTSTPWVEDGPVFSPDFETLYFTSEADGQPDIWTAKRADPERFWWQNDEFQLEKLTDDPATEWALSFTPDGERLAFIKGRGELHTVKPDGTEPVVVISGWSSPWYAFSPDAQWVAYSVDDEYANADIWIRRADGTGKPFNVSRHPDRDMNPAWSPDGRILAFVGRRWREETDICFVWLRQADEEEDKRERQLAKALEKMKGRKRPGTAQKRKGKTEKGDADRDPVAGRWAGRIAGSPPVPPEGLGLVMMINRAEDGALTGRVEVEELGAAELDTLEFDEKERKVTFTATTQMGSLSGEATLDGDRLDGTWVLEGLARGTFELEREPPAAEVKPKKPGKPEAAKGGEKKKGAGKKAAKVEIDFEGLEDRIHRISIPDASERGLLWSPDGKRLAFQATIDGARGLYTVTFPDDLRPKRLTSTIGDWERWLKEGNQIAWLAGGTPATMSASGKSRSFPFRVIQTVDVAARHAAGFDLAWRLMRDSFYDARLNNRDWDAVRAKYRPLAAEALHPDELETVVRMMLGELNGSHLGFSARQSRWSRPGWSEVTGHLGARFDPAYEGRGLKVRDVVRGSPADERDHRLLPGDVVVSVDGREANRDNWIRLLTGPADREIEIGFLRDGEDEPLTIRVRPTTYRRLRAALYDEWLHKARAQVDEKSDGRLGYVHVRGMSWSSFDRFETALYKAGHGKEGLIVDVRDNGGGFTADHLLTVLTQPQHARVIPRDGRAGYPQDRLIYARWSKPIVVLCNQNSFSNAEIFAHAIRTLGRGPVVGTPTGGGVISTGSTEVMDLGHLRLPFRGWFVLPTGADMERNGCVPDHVVWPQPGDESSGRDRQLEKAVAVLLDEVETAKADAPPRPRFASERPGESDR